jgi:hypothetical protein
MAYDPLAMADLVADAFDLSDAEVSDLVQAVPFLNLLPMEESSNGETHKYAKETGAPVVGFRAANVGRDEDSSTDSVTTVTLKILDFSWSVDKAVADVWRKGGREALIAREGMRHLKAAMVAFEKQLIYGATALGDSSGFVGMIQAATVDQLADALTIDATGTTADTASSCWAVRIGPNDLTGVFNGDEPMSLGETVVQRLISSGSLAYPAYYTPGCTWLGLQVGSIYSMGRIVNLTEDSGKGLTDDLIARLLEQFPIGFEPTHLLMSRRSRRQLQDSRTATTTTGAPAPFPQESFGVPIVTCESIVNTEALVT